MPRKGPAIRRELTPDPVYRSTAVTQLVNKVLQRGKRSTAERIVYSALATVESKTGAEPVGTLKRAIDNVRPQLEVRSRRVGGATYQVPVEVRPRRANTLAVRWLVPDPFTVVWGTPVRCFYEWRCSSSRFNRAAAHRRANTRSTSAHHPTVGPQGPPVQAP